MKSLTGLLLLLMMATPTPGAAQLSQASAGSAAGDPEVPGFPDPYGVDHTWASRDKLFHFGVSAVGAAAVYGGARWLGVKRWPAMALSVGLVGALGLLREVQDDRRPDKYFSEKDLIWNAAGIAVGIAIPDFLLFRQRDAEPAG